MPLPHLTLRGEPKGGAAQGVFLPTDQSPGSSVDQALYSALAGALMPSPKAEGRVARTGLWKMLSEWRFLLLLMHVGEGPPGEKLPANSRNSHLLPLPPHTCYVTRQTCQALPFRSLIKSPPQAQLPLIRGGS